MSQQNLNREPIVLASGATGVPLRIRTANPENFFQLVSHPESMPDTEIFGQLFIPEGTTPDAGWPVVILVPGSLGVAPSHLAKVDMLAELGIATCVIDPFGTRGVSSTVANQAVYSFAASAWDVLATVEMLCSRTDVDPERIGAQGHSRGGSAVLSAACLAQQRDSNLRLRGVYAAYPWCGQQFLLPAVGDCVVRSIVGDRDEWCLPQQVQGYMQAMSLIGAEASCRIVAGAHHSFDRDTPVELISDASVAPGAPTIYIRDNGAYVHPVTLEADPAFTERELMLYGIKAGYGIRGAHLGSAEGDAELFHADMLSFWRGVLTD